MSSLLCHFSTYRSKYPGIYYTNTGSNQTMAICWPLEDNKSSHIIRSPVAFKILWNSVSNVVCTLFVCLLACLIVCFFVCLFDCLFACLLFCLLGCMLACLFLCLLVCLLACLLAIMYYFFENMSDVCSISCSTVHTYPGYTVR